VDVRVHRAGPSAVGLDGRRAVAPQLLDCQPAEDTNAGEDQRKKDQPAMT
jgi:hypothetical protein